MIDGIQVVRQLHNIMQMSGRAS